MSAPINFARVIEDATLTRAEVAALMPAAGTGAIHLVGCDLEEADLGGLNLAGWRFDRCNLRRADLSNANLDVTQWLGCRGPFAKFFNADLSDAVIQSCDFNNANLRSARLTGARVTGSKLTGADPKGHSLRLIWCAVKAREVIMK
ncbi:MAG: hypothetical protein RLZZ444_4052 [Pseudomonadota bacterium]|jgi:uncharacterized protein YjbI with pentapeptide repeats